MPEIALLLVDRNQHFRRSLRALCEVNGGFVVVGEASGGEEALLLSRQLRPDVILMEAQAGDREGLATTRRIMREVPGARVLWLSLLASEPLARAARQAGVSGCLAKDCDQTTLFAAIRAAHEGRQFP